MYQQEELAKEARFLGRVTTLGKDRFVITVPKEDSHSIEHLKGKRVFVIARDATEPEEKQAKGDITSVNLVRALTNEIKGPGFIVVYPEGNEGHK